MSKSTPEKYQGDYYDTPRKKAIFRRTATEPATYTTGGRGYERWTNYYAGEQHEVKTHRLLAVSIFGFETVRGMEIHHVNGLKWDNRPDNIELHTPTEHRRMHMSGNSHAAKLTEEQAENIRSRYKSEEVTQKELADEYGVTKQTISKVILNVSTNHK